MITMGKSTHGFPFLPYMGMGLHLAALRAAGAPLLFLLLMLEYQEDDTAVMLSRPLNEIKRFDTLCLHMRVFQFC